MDEFNPNTPLTGTDAVDDAPAFNPNTPLQAPPSPVEIKLNQAHKYYTDHADEYWGRGSAAYLEERIPAVNIGASIGHYINLSGAIKGMKSGNPSDQDIDTLAQFKARQDYEAQKSGGGQALDMATKVPALVAEFAAAGGVGTAAKEAATAGLGKYVAEGLATKAAGYGAKLATQTALTPSMYIDHAVNTNIEKDRDPLDPRGLPGAFGLALAQNAVLGEVGRQTGKVFTGSGLGQAAGRVAVQAASGPFAQAATDAVTGFAGLSTGYGSGKLVLDGKYGEALQHAAMDALTFASFGVAHEIVSGGKGHKETTAAALDKIKGTIDAQAKGGATPEEAATALKTEIEAQTAAVKGEAPPETGAAFKSAFGVDMPTPPPPGPVAPPASPREAATALEIELRQAQSDLLNAKRAERLEAGNKEMSIGHSHDRAVEMLREAQKRVKDLQKRTDEARVNAAKNEAAQQNAAKGPPSPSGAPTPEAQPNGAPTTPTPIPDAIRAEHARLVETRDKARESGDFETEKETGKQITALLVANPGLKENSTYAKPRKVAVDPSDLGQQAPKQKLELLDAQLKEARHRLDVAKADEVQADASKKAEAKTARKGWADRVKTLQEKYEAAAREAAPKLPELTPGELASRPWELKGLPEEPVQPAPVKPEAPQHGRMKESAFRDNSTGEVYGTGAFHDLSRLPDHVRSRAERSTGDPGSEIEDGFINQRGQFVSRAELDASSDLPEGRSRGQSEDYEEPPEAPPAPSGPRLPELTPRELAGRPWDLKGPPVPEPVKPLEKAPEESKADHQIKSDIFAEQKAGRWPEGKLSKEKLNPTDLVDIKGITRENAGDLLEGRSDVGSLIDHLQAGGVIDPIIVKKSPKGRLQVLDGEHRATASALAGKSIEAFVINEEKTEPARKGFKLPDLTPGELADRPWELKGPPLPPPEPVKPPEAKTEPKGYLAKMRQRQAERAAGLQPKSDVQPVRTARDFTTYQPPTDYEKFGVTKVEAFALDSLMAGEDATELGKKGIMGLNSRQAIHQAAERATKKLGILDPETGKPKSATRIMAERSVEKSGLNSDGTVKDITENEAAVNNYIEEMAKKGTYLSPEEAKADMRGAADYLANKENAFNELWMEYLNEAKKRGVTFSGEQLDRLNDLYKAGQDPPPNGGRKYAAKQKKKEKSQARAAAKRSGPEPGVRNDPQPGDGNPPPADSGAARRQPAGPTKPVWNPDKLTKYEWLRMHQGKTHPVEAEALRIKNEGGVTLWGAIQRDFGKPEAWGKKARKGSIAIGSIAGDFGEEWIGEVLPKNYFSKNGAALDEIAQHYGMTEEEVLAKLLSNQIVEHNAYLDKVLNEDELNYHRKKFIDEYLSQHPEATQDEADAAAEEFIQAASKSGADQGPPPEVKGQAGPDKPARGPSAGPADDQPFTGQFRGEPGRNKPITGPSLVDEPTPLGGAFRRGLDRFVADEAGSLDIDNVWNMLEKGRLLAMGKDPEKVAESYKAAREKQKEEGLRAGKEANRLGREIIDRINSYSDHERRDRELDRINDMSVESLGIVNNDLLDQDETNKALLALERESRSLWGELGARSQRLQAKSQLILEGKMPLDRAGFFSDEAGSLDLDKVKEFALQTKQKFMDGVRAAQLAARNLGHEMFPATHDESPEVGNKMSTFATSRMQSERAKPYFIDKVLGENVTEHQSKLWWTTLKESRLRYAAAEALARGDLEGAKRASRTFVGVTGSALKDEAIYLATLKDADFLKAVDNYKTDFVPIAEQFYKEAAGIDPADSIDSLTQIPGLPVPFKAIREGDKGGIGLGPSAGSLSAPKLRKLGATNEAKFSAEKYEDDFREMLGYIIDSRVETANKHEMIRTGVAKGQMEWAAGGPERITTEGGMVMRKVPDVNPPKGTQENAKGERTLYVNEKIFEEMKNALNMNEPGTSTRLVRSVADKINAANLFVSTGEFLYHGTNQATMFFTKPGMRYSDLFSNIRARYDGNPAFKAKMMEIARLGADKPSYGEKGNDSLLKLGSRMLDGLSDVMRATAHDAYQRLAKEARAGGIKFDDSPQAERNFINQLGKYERRSQHGLVQWLRDSGIGPFATAGSNYVEQSVRALGLDPGIKGEGVYSKLYLRANFLKNITIAAGTIAAINFMRWGRVDGDDRTPFGNIKLWEDGRGSHSIDVTAPFLVKRGLRTTGLLSMIEGGRGATPTATNFDKGFDDVLHAFLHPTMGPAAQAALIAAKGYNTIGMQVAEKAQPGESQLPKNLKAAALNVNPIVAAATGTARPNDQRPMLERFGDLAGPYGPRVRQRPVGNTRR